MSKAQLTRYFKDFDMGLVKSFLLSKAIDCKNNGVLNLLTNVPVKITGQNAVSKKTTNSLGTVYNTSLVTKAGAVYEITTLP